MKLDCRIILRRPVLAAWSPKIDQCIFKFVQQMHGDENNASFAIPGQAVSWLIAVLGTFVAKWE